MKYRKITDVYNELDCIDILEHMQAAALVESLKDARSCPLCKHGGRDQSALILTCISCDTFCHIKCIRLLVGDDVVDFRCSKCILIKNAGNNGEDVPAGDSGSDVVFADMPTKNADNKCMLIKNAGNNGEDVPVGDSGSNVVFADMPTKNADNKCMLIKNTDNKEDGALTDDLVPADMPTKNADNKCMLIKNDLNKFILIKNADNKWMLIKNAHNKGEDRALTDGDSGSDNVPAGMPTKNADNKEEDGVQPDGDNGSADMPALGQADDDLPVDRAGADDVPADQEK